MIGYSRLTSSKKFFNELLFFIEDLSKKLKRPIIFLDFGSGQHNILGRYLKDKFSNKIIVYVHDEININKKSLGETIFLDKEMINKKKFDIIHLSAVIHELSDKRINNLIIKEEKGGPLTKKAFSLLKEINKITDYLIVEDYHYCELKDYIDNHYFLSQFNKKKKNDIKEYYYLIEKMLLNNKKNKAYSNIFNFYPKKINNIIYRLFINKEHIKAFEFKKLSAEEKIFVFLKKYHQHNNRIIDFENLFQKTGFLLLKKNTLTYRTQWFLKKNSNK